MEKNRSPGVGYFAGIDADIAAQRFLIRKPPAYICSVTVFLDRN